MNLALAAALLLLATAVCGKTTPTPTKKGSTKPTTPPTKAPTCPKSAKDYYVQIKVLGQGDYSYEMTQFSSVAFQDVREKLYDCVLTLYADYDFYQDLILLSIENASSGYVPGFAVRFTKAGDGHLNRLTQAVNAGKLCDMEVAPKFIKCDELDQSMLYPMANCPSPCGDMNCWPACDASCCQQSPEQTVYLPVAPPAPPPPPPPPMMPMCGATCPATCAPSCSPTCCFVQKRWLQKQKAQQFAPKAAGKR